MSVGTAATGPGQTVTMTPEALAAIERHAAETYPHECCGALLTSDGGVIVATFALTNTTDGPAARRFLVGPDEYRRAEQWARAQGGTLAGFYHSHPDHPARPSPTDLEYAWPNFLYIIVSVVERVPRDVTCWRLREDRSAFERGDLKSWRTES
jgi:proteasome lid subunit RPN8/RPN11